MKSLKIYTMTVVALSCVSCYDDALYEAMSKNGVDVQSVSMLSRSTNDENLYLYQTDKLGMLINSIIEDENGYILTLSLEDANSLGISDSLYRVAEAILNDYNELKEN